MYIPTRSTIGPLHIVLATMSMLAACGSTLAGEEPSTDETRLALVANAPSSPAPADYVHEVLCSPRGVGIVTGDESEGDGALVEAP